MSELSLRRVPRMPMRLTFRTLICLRDCRAARRGPVHRAGLLHLTGVFRRVFFSSRIRHTRSLCDWSSDVCSSDLQADERTLELANVRFDLVAIYIAGKINSIIRELEGSLIRLIAYASLTGQEISPALAQQVLKNVLDTEDKAVTIEIIQKFVADYYNLKLVELKSRNNSKSVAMPRQIAMYLCKALTHASLPEIGRSFGGKHHSTVIHSIRKVEDLRKKDGDFNILIGNFLEGFH